MDYQNINYADIQEAVSAEKYRTLPPLRLSILRNVTLEAIEPYLKYLAIQEGFRAEIGFGEYAGMFSEAAGGAPHLLNKDTHCVIVFLHLETISGDLVHNLAGLSSERVEEEKQRVKGYVGGVLAGIRRQTAATILWHSFEMPVYPALGIADYQSENYQMAVIAELNSFLRQALRDAGQAYYVEMNTCLARIGSRNFYDKRYWHIGRAPYSRAACREIAWEDFKFIRAALGRNKKCLILDCDNTLWGGIVGEDGLAGIKLGLTYPGSMYREFQQEILNLYHRGIILALCSKNNQDDILEVFRNHPDMVLKEEHIATYRINWEDKVTNIRQIAEDLNIMLDSMVFVDDSDFEIGLVRQMLPEVKTILLPAGKSVEYREILASSGLFDMLTISAEDRERGAMYRAETKRKKLATIYTDMDSYYKSLEMEVVIRMADDFSIPRISQLTKKTNQFNLTTRRYSELEVKEMANQTDVDVLYLALSDLFGDSGIVGVAILRYRDEEALIDSFLLSCRILGREVENVFLSHCLKLARFRGSRSVIGQYLATSKNMQVKDFFPRRGFRVVEEDEQKSKAIYDFLKPDYSIPTFFKSVKSDVDDLMEKLGK
ncbi:MAG: HAD-IIIC family phosphatase [Syntrophales bacterium]|jgi:FkbH-like protein